MPPANFASTDPKVSRALLNAMGLAVEDARKAQSMLREWSERKRIARFRR